MSKLSPKLIVIIIIVIIIVILISKQLLLSLENKYLYPYQRTKIILDSIPNLIPNAINKKIQTEDCAQIDTLHFVNSNIKSHSKLIIFAHGNASNIYNQHNLYNFYDKINQLEEKYDLLLFDYRGYGQSDGKPSHKKLKLDIKAVWDHALKQGYKPENINLYGESLGCSLVSWLGSHLVECNRNNQTTKLPNSIILQSGFYNLAARVKDLRLPTFLLQNKWKNDEYIKKISNKIPILVLHSREDTTISFEHAIKLSKLDGVKFYEISGPHSNPILDGECINIIVELLDCQIY